MSRLKRLKNIDSLIKDLQTIISQSQCSLSEVELNLLNEAIAKLTMLRSKKGLTDKHYQVEISDILELIYNFLTK
ncbi:hypothetical protein ODZ84_11240 [Chryseobacterium fluminis]|uniref:hypothetical protein n=1 Tax=Chryseobacterium fluminis TaxID=2983606 RepID=UPI002251A09D|nr:hypothetical protein [Chryseobacterium sp. MMS21-Ot14]UZU00099.1 hypothetical protein ODZ84_11240 [Chryseobacterium sp. MMS21-Ot14]